MVKFLGYTIVKTPAEEEKKVSTQPLPSDNEHDGALEVNAGFYGYGVNIDNNTFEDETALITKYRDLANQPEIEKAVNAIINQAFSYDNNAYPVEINLDELDKKVVPEQMKVVIKEEFKYLLDLLDFKNKAYDIFKDWYVDGRLFYQKVINNFDTTQGIVELVYIDPRKIRKVKEELKQKGTQNLTNAATTLSPLNVVKKKYLEYYVYNPNGIAKTTPQGIKLTLDSITYIHSGKFDKSNRIVLSYLHKAIRYFNILRMLEDAIVIYRITRAPERRVINVEVGRLPHGKAEQYIKEMMDRFRRKLQYDATTGEVKDDRRYMTMQEDYWFPQIDGKGATIEQLPGGQNLGQMDDVNFFKEKLYEALEVPPSRFQIENNPFNPQASEISRDELAFMDFIIRLRKRFNGLFDDLLETHLVLKGILTKDEWDQIKGSINYDYNENNYFSEVKNQQIWMARFDAFGASQNAIQAGVVSKTYVRRNILNISDEEFKQMEKELVQEREQDLANGVDSRGMPLPPPEMPIDGDGDGQVNDAENGPQFLTGPQPQPQQIPKESTGKGPPKGPKPKPDKKKKVKESVYIGTDQLITETLDYLIKLKTDE